MGGASIVNVGRLDWNFFSGLMGGASIVNAGRVLGWGTVSIFESSTSGLELVDGDVVIGLEPVDGDLSLASVDGDLSPASVDGGVLDPPDWVLLNGLDVASSFVTSSRFGLCSLRVKVRGAAVALLA